jgi:uncharacterized membrane protein
MAIGTNDTAASHGNHQVSTTINAPLELVYTLWTKFENFPYYFHHILQVQANPDNPLIQHCRGKLFGVEQEWDAEITILIPHHVIAWRSVKGFENSGSLTFERRESVTVLTVQIGYNPPLGILGDVAEALWHKRRFDASLEEDMARFNQLCERQYGHIHDHAKDTDSLLS